MICVPFTLIPVIDVFCVPEKVIVVDGPAFDTTGVKPRAPEGPMTVTTAPEEVAVYPFWVIAVATRPAIVVGLFVNPVGPLMICVPFTVMPVTDACPEPEKVIVDAGAPAVVTTGVKPSAPGGPVTVTVLPDAVAL